jgi:toxin ParE1/3/4
MSKSKFNIRFLSIAEEDFTEIISFIASDNVRAAENMATKIEKNLELLSENPLLDKIPADEDLKLLDYRYLIIENYIIFYTIEQKSIYIHRILHGARNYKSLLL